MDEHSSVALVVRNLGGAWRALRLYPPSSPMPMQAAEAVCKAVDDHLNSEPSLKLVVVREGFLLRGVDKPFTAPGVPDLADALGAHSIAELTFIAPPTTEEVLAFLAASREQPRDIQDQGGLQAVISGAEVRTIRLVPVALANAEAPLEIPEDEADTFLARLAADPSRLAMWLRSLLTYDDEGLVEGLQELASRGRRRDGVRRVARPRVPRARDRTARTACSKWRWTSSRSAAISTVMLANLSTVELTAAVRGGRYGTNPLSLSWALTRLPLGERSQGLIDETGGGAALRRRSRRAGRSHAAPRRHPPPRAATSGRWSRRSRPTSSRSTRCG